MIAHFSSLDSIDPPLRMHLGFNPIFVCVLGGDVVRVFFFFGGGGVPVRSRLGQFGVLAVDLYGFAFVRGNSA